MSKPEGTLSAAQFELLEVTWKIGPPGGTKLQIWEIVSESRPIVRSTVTNLVDRLVKRGWLRREEQLYDGWHFWPTVTRQEAEAMLAEDFVDSFFKSSASQLFASLVGEERVGPDELAKLKRMIEEAERKPKRKSKRKQS